MGPPASTAKRQIALSKAPAVVKRPTMAAAARPARFATPAFEGINMSSSPAPPAASTPTLASSPPAEFPTPAAPTPVQTNHFASHEASQFELAYDSSSHLPMDPVPPAPVVPDRPSSLDHATSAPTLTDTAMDVRPDCTPLQEPHERAQSFPAAVPVTVHSSSLPHRTPTLSDMQTTHDASSAVTPAQSVLAAVREVPALYQLTTPELERAIGEIVREQGFLDFVRTCRSGATPASLLIGAAWSGRRDVEGTRARRSIGASDARISLGQFPAFESASKAGPREWQIIRRCCRRHACMYS